MRNAVPPDSTSKHDISSKPNIASEHVFASEHGPVAPRPGKKRGRSLGDAASVLQVGRLAWFIAIMIIPGCQRGQPYFVTTDSGLIAFPGTSTYSTKANPAEGSPTAVIASSTSPAAGASTSLLATSTNPSIGASPAVPPAEVAEWERRAQALDESNRILHTQLAQSQQQAQLYKDRADLMQRQLQDVASQARQTRVAIAPPPAAALPSVAPMGPPRPSVPESSLANSRFNQPNGPRSSARLTASSGTASSRSTNIGSEGKLEALKGLGYPVVAKGSQIRLRIPSDQLFVPNTSQVTGSGAAILDRIAEILKREYPQSRIAIEGHTDASPQTAGPHSTHHELASAQSSAVLEIFSHRHGFPASQLSTLAHGANDPLQDNQTPAGRAANRRLEFVIESEEIR